MQNHPYLPSRKIVNLFNRNLKPLKYTDYSFDKRGPKEKIRKSKRMMKIRNKQQDKKWDPRYCKYFRNAVITELKFKKNSQLKFKKLS